MFQTLTPPNSTSPLQFQSHHPPSDRRSPKSASVRCTPAVRDRPATLYDALRVKPDASLAEIKLAYRNMAKLCHPDAASAGSDACDFMEIRRAYEKLSDPATRAVYDASLGFCGRLTSASFGCDSVSVAAGRRGSGLNPTRRWETDQCW